MLQIKKKEIEEISNDYNEREKFLDGLELVIEGLDNFYLNDMLSAKYKHTLPSITLLNYNHMIFEIFV